VSGQTRIAAAIAVIVFSMGAKAADMPLKAAALPAPPPGPLFELFGGVSVGPDSVYGDAGGVFAINHSLNNDGWLFRLRGGAGHYDYNRSPGVGQGVDFQTGEFMLGYQKFFGATRVSGYVGPNVENHDNPDPVATVKGTKWGIKGQGEVFMPFSDRGYVLLLATASSAFSSYFVLGKAGYNVAPGVSVGPELVFMGNDRFDATRLGPFVAFDVGPGAQLILSGGYQWDNRSDSLNDHSGGYFTAHARKVF
jgi:hypothetical protein